MVSPALRAARDLRKRLEMRREYTPDIEVLRNVLFPALAERPDIHRVLFVGVDFYTKRYHEFFPRQEFWTIDINADKARYGAPRHIVDSLENLGEHFEPGSLDAIVCTGVLGWGLNGREETDVAIGACFDCLRPDGVFVLGWSDSDGRRPAPLAAIESLRRFEPTTLPPFVTPVYQTFSHHRDQFEFYVKPRAAEVAAPGLPPLSAEPSVAAAP